MSTIYNTCALNGGHAWILYSDGHSECRLCGQCRNLPVNWDAVKLAQAQRAAKRFWRGQTIRADRLAPPVIKLDDQGRTAEDTNRLAEQVDTALYVLFLLSAAAAGGGLLWACLTIYGG